jgi:hypothetical protein
MTYARLLQFKMKPGSGSVIQELVNKFDPVLKARKGFKGVTFFSDATTGESGALILWDSEENAEAARAEVFPKFEEAVKGLLTEPPRHPLFKVIEPKV